MKIDFVLANSADPDEMQHSAAFRLGLHSWKGTSLKVSLLQRANKCSQVSFSSDIPLVYSKNCVKRTLSKRPNNGFQDQ